MSIGPARYTIAVDFDGVLHRYDTPWVAPHVIPDEPVRGAIVWLSLMIQKFNVLILTTRARTWRGRRAIHRWLVKHGGNLYYGSPGHRGIADCVVTNRKGPALVYIDDRGWRFEGANFPSIEDIHQALPWHKETTP